MRYLSFCCLLSFSFDFCLPDEETAKDRDPPENLGQVKKKKKKEVKYVTPPCVVDSRRDQRNDLATPLCSSAFEILAILVYVWSCTEFVNYEVVITG